MGATEKRESLSAYKKKRAREKREKELQNQDLKGHHKRFTWAMFELEMHDAFSVTVTGVIVFAGILAGIQTYEVEKNGWKVVFDVLESIINIIFTAECVVKILARGKSPLSYFTDAWNVFDFIIVVLAYVPLDFNFAILRTIRLLRVLKLLNALPALQILVGSLLKSVKSMVYIIMLLFLLFYLYAVMGCFLFQENDPFHFRSLEISLLSLYRVSTFEDWTDIMYINMWGCDRFGYPLSVGTMVNGTMINGTLEPGTHGYWVEPPSFFRCDNPKKSGVVAALFFCSFTLFATMIVFNLFVGVILTNIDKARGEMEEEMRMANNQHDVEHDNEKQESDIVLAEQVLGDFDDVLHNLFEDFAKHSLFEDHMDE